ncbi:wings apart-like protein homolog [Procambarus clarkii]|uniref:wings apart-like protein homolog n=1 Tax=Procambarus clarkii TaxID=6728 RepID=UPI001E678137|nr:wings apart-like protein homolog [Procambarus clarkii]
MSGRYSRTYSRKKAAPPPISQFDKLVTEPGSSNSTKPSATKTAGHVGKWGITSFTSLRSINGGLGKDDSGKRYADDSPPSSIGDDAYSFDSGNPANGASLQVRPPIKTFSKPRKFFKSRNTEVVSEPPKTLVDKARGKVSDGLYNMKIPPLSSFESPDSSQGTVKSSLEASEESVFDKLVTSAVAKPNNSETVTSSKSSSGIKLKIFKSRNVASCSQETYSSTVELPSDDSRAGSASTSVASSPSTKDFSEENRDSSEELVPSGSPLTEYKESQVTLSNISSRDTNYHSPDRLASPNRTSNTTIDSSFEFAGLMDQRTGLPVDMCIDDSFSFSGKKSNSETPHSSVKKSYSSKFSKSGELNKYMSKNIEPISSSSDIDTRQNVLSGEVCDGPLTDDFDIFSMSTSDFGEPRKMSPVGRSVSPGVSSGVGDGESDNFDLFSTDFDENEIEDRTSLEVAASSDLAIKDSTSVAEEQEMEDLLFSTQGSIISSQASTTSSYESFKPGHSTKAESEGVKKIEQPPLVKKRSIFKSRDADRDAKKRATYRHKWHDQDEKDDSSKQAPPALPSSQSASSAASAFDEFDFETPTLKRVHTWPGTGTGDLDDSTEAQSVTSVKCAKGVKQYYTVVKNVKRTHQLQESGEFQEFNDDVEYFLDALRPSMPVSTRCLAALNLAQKCMVPAFRMHLRAHGTVIKFFSALSDAHSDHRLAICAATVMFTLSQDRLNMDLDRDSLELMLNLLDTDADTLENVPPVDASFVTQNKKKIMELCRDMQKKGHAKHLGLDNINAGNLAMETLLSLTSKRAGEWFKEELRELGGVEHLIRTITNCTQHFSPDLEMWSHPLLEKLSKVDRCLKVLENVTHQNTANQEYLLTFQNGIFLEKLMSLYRMCHVEVPLYPACETQNQKSASSGVAASQLLVKALLTTIKVLINLTHNSGKEALGSKLLGDQQDVYDITLYCLLIMPRYLAPDKRFELLILACCLLLNLVEHSKANRNVLMKTKAPDIFEEEDERLFCGPTVKKGAMQALIELFYRSEESARQQEAHTNEIIDHDLTEQSKQKEDEKKEDEIEETVAKLLQKAGHHMEDTLIAAYTALLTGYCIMEDEECEAQIRAMLPEANFSLMVNVLKKFLRFMDLTASTSLLRSLKPTERVVKYMEKLDASEEEAEAEIERKKQEAKEMEFDAFGF